MQTTPRIEFKFQVKLYFKIGFCVNYAASETLDGVWESTRNSATNQNPVCKYMHQKKANCNSVYNCYQDITDWRGCQQTM